MKHFIAIASICLGAAMLHADSNDNHSDRADSTSLAISGGKLNHNRPVNWKRSSPKTRTTYRLVSNCWVTTSFLGTTRPHAKAAYQTHVFWFIKNHPDAEITGTPYCSLNAILDPDGYRQKPSSFGWTRYRSHEKQVSILGNAASFFLLNDQRDGGRIVEKTQRAGTR